MLSIVIGSSIVETKPLNTEKPHYSIRNNRTHTFYWTLLTLICFLIILWPESHYFFTKQNPIVKIPNAGLYTNLICGVGDQIFQYACTIKIALKLNLTFGQLVMFHPNEFDTTSISSVNNFKQDSEDCAFAIPQFYGQDWEEVLPEQYNESEYTLTMNLKHVFNYTQVLYGNHSQYEILDVADYCNSNDFIFAFKKEFLTRYHIDKEPLAKWLKKIENDDSVAIHVRRGEPLPTPVKFYQKSITRVYEILKNSNITFFVFSDNMTVAEEEFKSGNVFLNTSDVHWIDPINLTRLQELYLMSRCKHNVIPWSTLSWWAAYLNPNPDNIVISARFSPTELKKVKQKFEKFYDIYLHYAFYPSEWIVLDY